MDTLGQIAVELTADQNQLQRGFDDAIRGGRQAGDSTGSEFALGFRSRALNAIGALGDLKDGLQEIGRTAYESSGLRIAGDYQTLRVGLTGVIGDAKEAKRVFEELDALGGNTAFDTSKLIGLSRGLIGVGVDTKSVTGDIRAMSDAVATVAGNSYDLERLAENLGQIRSSIGNPELTDLKQLTRMGLNLDKIVGSAIGKELEPGGGARALQSMTGRQAYDTIIKGFDATYGGNAKTMADSTFQGVAANAQEAISKIMLPTGEALIPAFTTASATIRNTADTLKSFNESTGGSAGLIATIGLGSVVVRKLKGDFDTTVGSIVRLTTAIDTLAGHAGNATVKLGSATARFDANNVSLPAGGGKWDWKRIALEGAPYAVGIAGGIGASIANNTGNPRLGRQLGDGASYSQMFALGGSAIGGLAGAAIGTWVAPGLGTAGGAVAGSQIGGAVGSAIGFGVGAYQGGKAYDKENSLADAQDDATRATKELAQAMDKTRFTLMGGGTRAGAEASALEAEYAMIRMSRAGGLA